MKRYYLFIIAILSTSVFAINDVLIKQGHTELTLQDIDGFAFKMPNDIRSGFFGKPDRVEKTLGTLLNMKHVYEYSQKNNIIDSDTLNQKVDEVVQVLFAYDASKNNIMEKEKTYKAIRKFLVLEENYKLFQNSLLQKISDDDVIEYAKEYYKLHRNDFQIPETRKIQYLSLVYDDSNKIEKSKQIAEIKSFISSQGLDFGDNILKNKFNDVKVSGILKYFAYSKKQKVFSDFVYNQNSIGFIDDILVMSNQLLLVKILDISPMRIAKFNEVKDELLTKFKNEKFQRDLKEVLINLTKDPIVINDKNMKELAKRYN